MTTNPNVVTPTVTAPQATKNVVNTATGQALGEGYTASGGQTYLVTPTPAGLETGKESTNAGIPISDYSLHGGTMVVNDPTATRVVTGGDLISNAPLSDLSSRNATMSTPPPPIIPKPVTITVAPTPQPRNMLYQGAPSPIGIIDYRTPLSYADVYYGLVMRDGKVSVSVPDKYGYGQAQTYEFSGLPNASGMTKDELASRIYNYLNANQNIPLSAWEFPMEFSSYNPKEVEIKNPPQPVYSNYSTISEVPAAGNNLVVSKLGEQPEVLYS